MKKYVIAGVSMLLVIVAGVAVYFSNLGGIQSNLALGSSAANSFEGSVPFTKLSEGTTSDVHTRTNYLVSSPEKLAALWALLSSAEAVPAVDFDKSVVIAIFAGDEPTTGYSLSVSGIEDTSATRMVHVALSKPDAGCITGQMVTQPYIILQVPKTTLAFSHTDTENVQACAN